jgi:hypothetical protein
MKTLFPQLSSSPRSAYATAIAIGIVLAVLPLTVGLAGNAWVRMLDFALLYIMLALGLNIVVGYAGLLDLGYVAFYAVGAYLYALLSSPHLMENFEWIAAMFPDGFTADLDRDPAGGGIGRSVRRAARRAHAEAARRLSCDRHARLRRDRAHLPEQPERSGEHHQRPAGHQQHRPGAHFGLQTCRRRSRSATEIGVGPLLLLPVPGAGDRW